MNDDKNWLYALAGIPTSAERLSAGGIRDDVIALLSETGSQMMEAGIKFTRHDWRRLGELERSALVLAGKRRRVNQALNTGIASQGKKGVASVMSELDKGEELEQVTLEDFVLGLHKLKGDENAKR